MKEGFDVSSIFGVFNIRSQEKLFESLLSKNLVLSSSTFSGAPCIYLSRAGNEDWRLERRGREGGREGGKEQGREKWRKRSRAWYAVPNE